VSQLFAGPCYELDAVLSIDSDRLRYAAIEAVCDLLERVDIARETFLNQLVSQSKPFKITGTGSLILL
jgi:hypothetical protein